MSQADPDALPRHDDGAERGRVPWPVILVAYFLGPTLITGFRGSVNELSSVNPALLILGVGLEGAALLCYSLLTLAALPKRSVSLLRLFRIQLSTKSLSNILPAGSAAGNALGYRLLILSGVEGADAGFALATVGLGSAVVLNVMLLVALVVSIPIRGVNPAYGAGAAAGVILIGLAAIIVIGLLRGQARAERIVRSVAGRLRFEPDRAVEVIRHVANRMRALLDDRRLLGRIVFWAVANWALDMASLWVFLRAFGGSAPVDGLIIAFGLANVLAVIPLTPGGVGVIEGVMIPTLAAFGLTKSVATLGVFGYRGGQYWLPMLVGGLCYLSLRLGPWSIERRDGLKRLRDVAGEGVRDDTSGIEWAEKFGRRDATNPSPRPPIAGEVLRPGQ